PWTRACHLMRGAAGSSCRLSPLRAAFKRAIDAGPVGAPTIQVRGTVGSIGSEPRAMPAASAPTAKSEPPSTPTSQRRSELFDTDHVLLIAGGCDARVRRGRPRIGDEREHETGVAGARFHGRALPGRDRVALGAAA